MDDEPRTYRQYRFTRPLGACEILLVRHAESAAADPDRPFALVDGHSDPPLHADGVVQAHQVCGRLIDSGEDFAAVYVTNLQRTRQTAQPLLEHLGIDPTVEPDLREVMLGEFEGGELRRRATLGDPVLADVWAQERWDAIPGAEPDDAFEARVRQAIQRIATAHADQTVAVFTHGGVIGKVLQLAGSSRGFAFAGADNASVSHLVVLGELWVIRSFNDTAHLSPRFTVDPEPLI